MKEKEENYLKGGMKGCDGVDWIQLAVVRIHFEKGTSGERKAIGIRPMILNDVFEEDKLVISGDSFAPAAQR